MNFKLLKPKPWTPLTEIESKLNKPIGKQENPLPVSKPHAGLEHNISSPSSLLKSLLHDLIVYQFDSIKVRVDRLGCSVRGFEHAKREGLEKGFFIESYCGKLLHLILVEKGYESLQEACPYNKNEIEHSFYIFWAQHNLKKSPRYKKVACEYPVGTFGATGDIVAFTHDGHREAFEITFSTNNILANAAKYIDANFSRIVFLCRNYQLKEGVRICCRESGLSDNLLQRLEFMQLSSLVRNAKMNS